MTLSVIFYPYHFVRAILSISFCPMPCCPYTILSIPFCPYHFVRYHFVIEPFKAVPETQKLVVGLEKNTWYQSTMLRAALWSDVTLSVDDLIFSSVGARTVSVK